MTENKFKTEWIVAHLLFPNSAQAREIYLFFAAQKIKLKNSLDNHEHKKLLFKKAIELFRKTPIIQSGYSFSEFNQYDFKLWPDYYKKLNKDEVLIVIGLVFLELKISEIASMLRLNLVVTEGKFYQLLNKIILKPQTTQSLKYKFKYRSVDMNEKSDLTYYDEIITGVFGIRKNSIQETKNALKDDPRIHLKKFFENLSDFKNEIVGLKNKTFNIIQPEYEIINVKKINFLNFKNLILYLPTAVFAIAFLIIFLLRPQFVQNTLSIGKNDTIEIQQIKINRQTENKNLKAPVLETSGVTIVNKPTDELEPSDSNQKISLNINSPEMPPAVANRPEQQKIASRAIVPALKEKIKSVFAASSGGVFRGTLIVTDVQQVLGAVREKIINLGGKKAGEVELGWMKNETTSYFHFSFPEENKDSLESYLGQFGKIQLAFEPHSRIMPKGIKRYIIEIKQNE